MHLTLDLLGVIFLRLALTFTLLLLSLSLHNSSHPELFTVNIVEHVFSLHQSVSQHECTDHEQEYTDNKYKNHKSVIVLNLAIIAKEDLLVQIFKSCLRNQALSLTFA